MLLSASRSAGSKCTCMAIWICTWEKETEHEQFIRRLPLSIIPFRLNKLRPSLMESVSLEIWMKFGKWRMPTTHTRWCFLLIPVLWKVQEKATWSVTDQDTDQVNGRLGWDLDHKPIEQGRAGRDDGFPPARRIIGRENTWTSSRKRRAPVKAPIFGLEQFPQTNGNVSGIQTFGCLSHATSKPFPCWRGNKKSKRRQPCWLISMK